MTVIFLVGLVDDLMTLSPGFKLLGQVVAAANRDRLRAQDRLRGEPRSAGGSCRWACSPRPSRSIYIVGFTNVINLIDGLDGLAAGVTASRP